MSASFEGDGRPVGNGPDVEAGEGVGMQDPGAGAGRPDMDEMGLARPLRSDDGEPPLWPGGPAVDLRQRQGVAGRHEEIRAAESRPGGQGQGELGRGHQGSAGGRPM